jgi:hypothetical protein
MTNDELALQLTQSMEALEGHVMSKLQVFERAVVGLSRRVEDLETANRDARATGVASERRLTEHDIRMDKLEQIQAGQQRLYEAMETGFRNLGVMIGALK